MPKQDTIIRLEKVHKAFGRLVVLDGVDLSIRAGETTVVIGPSGCGKSVLLKHIVGLLRPDRGKVFFREHLVSGMSERQLVPVRRRIGFLFQGGALFDSMTVEQNLCFPLTEHAVGTEAERKARCREVLALVGLDGLQGRMPAELSGGQRKRVALARAIALRPEVILYDEPTTGLDPVRADLINELILRLQAGLGTTAVVVTHDMASARKVGDRIVMLHEGVFIVDTTPDKLDHIDNEAVAHFVEGRASREELAEI
ncbi:MAG TPA: ABC transporter ATP-binding protein [Phycisphaerae bacterium]|nr:ABC transporter ATP-binding protein [Phycisphaerae bacterium]